MRGHSLKGRLLLMSILCQLQAIFSLYKMLSYLKYYNRRNSRCREAWSSIYSKETRLS